MPRVPSVGLSPTSRPQFQAPGVVAFQGGPELQQIARGGARLERIGRIVGQIGIEIEDKVNDARAMEATNTFENSANRLLFDYRQKKGKDAVEARAELDQQMKELRDGAGGMLLNDTQRIQFNRIADKIGSRSSLAFDEHYAKAAAEDKQQQNLARQVVVSDSIANNDIGPQSVVAFGQFNNLVREEGEARGLSGDALEVFALSKRDQLLQGIVTQKLDSKDPAQIMQVEGLLDSLPDGVISQTQKQSLTQLVSRKSRETDAFAWAAQSFQNDKTYQELLQQVDEMALSDPKRAKAYQQALDSRYTAGLKAKNEARSSLLQTLSDKLVGGEMLTAEETQQARASGITFDLEKLQNDIESERGQTTPSGKAVYAGLLNNIPALMEIGTGAEVFAYARSRGMSYADATNLAGQRNRYSETTTAGRRSSGKSNSSRVEFDEFDTDEDQVVETTLFHLDGKHAKEKGIRPYRKRVSNTYGSDLQERNYALRMMVDRYKVDVMKVANAMLAQIPEGETIDRNEMLQRAAATVYKRGWVDEDHRINRYTTEYQWLPDVPDDIAAKIPEAREQLRAEERNAVVQRALSGDPGMKQVGGMIVQAEMLEQVARTNVFNPGVARALSNAMRQASAVEATSPISEADVQARAQILLRQEKQEEHRRSEAVRQSSIRDIAGVLFGTEGAQLKAVLVGTTLTGATRKTGLGRLPASVAADYRISKFLHLPAVKEARQMWQETAALDEDWETEFEAFALQFYPGPKRDEKFLPEETKKMLRNLPRSSDMPGQTLSRWDALKQRYNQ